MIDTFSVLSVASEVMGQVDVPLGLEERKQIQSSQSLVGFGVMP